MRATSSTVRHIGPTRSLIRFGPNMPSRLTSATGAGSPTRSLFFVGLRTDGPDSSPMAQVTRLAATDAPEPPLDRPGLRSVSYGLQNTPPNEPRSPDAYSPMFALPMMIAPASRSFLTNVESSGGRSLA